jgi:hypothetical protein
MGLPRNPLDLNLVAAPVSPAEAVKEFVLDGVYGARNWAQRFWEDFRQSDRFLKYKVGIIAGWVAISLATLVGTCSGERPVLDTSNAIGAFAKFQRSADLGVSAVLLENHSHDQWKQVALTMDDAYSSLLPKVEAGGHAVVEIRKFNGAKGETPPPDFRPQKLEIRCSEGKAVVDLRENP